MPAVSAASSGRWRGSTPNSPSAPGAVSASTASLSLMPSGVTISRARVSAMRSRGSGRGGLHLGCRRLHFFDVAAHVEGLLGEIVERAGQDLLEPGDRLLERDVL